MPQHLLWFDVDGFCSLSNRDPPIGHRRCDSTILGSIDSPRPGHSQAIASSHLQATAAYLTVARIRTGQFDRV